MKKTMLFFLLAAALQLPAGVITPQPQQVLSAFSSHPLSGKIDVDWSDRDENRRNADAVEAVCRRLLPQLNAGQGLDLEITMYIDPSLPPQGYTVSGKNDGDEFEVRIAASTPRGLYYGVATLAQMLTVNADGSAVLDFAEIKDFPVWRNRYVSDVLENATFDRYVQHLTRCKISGICLRTEGNWQNPEWFAKAAPVLADVKKAAELDVADTMIQMHMFNSKNGSRPINLASEDDIQMTISAARRFAESGVAMLMIAVDDLTPREGKYFTYHTDAEKAKFGANAGRGHGYLMKRLYDALHPDFPELKLAMVVAPYAIENHGIMFEETREYFRQWGEEAPRDVYLVWTGPHVFSTEVAKADQLKVEKLLKGQKMFIFDNNNGTAAPMPVCNTKFYPEMAEESDGTILLWGSVFIRPLEAIYYQTAIDYLWNPAAYNADSAYPAAAALLYGRAAAIPLTRLQKAFQAMTVEKSSGSRADFAPFFDEFEAALKAAQQVKAADGKPLPLTQMVDQLANAKNYMEHPLKRIAITPEPGEILLSDRSGKADGAPTRVTISGEKDGLRLHFTVPNKNVPPVEKKPHDAPVFLSDDNIEIFIQPSERAEEWIFSEPPSNSYAHLVFDSSGNKYDEAGCSSVYQYDPEWSVETSSVDGGWQADVFIPYTSLNERFIFTAPVPGAVWKANFHRVNNQTKLVQSWDNGGESFHNTDYFGELEFK